jgi:hypothetical protein
MSPKIRRRFIVVISVAVLVAAVHLMRSRMLARNEAEFHERYDE